jgi:hypothetical protein
LKEEIPIRWELIVNPRPLSERQAHKKTRFSTTNTENFGIAEKKEIVPTFEEHIALKVKANAI